MATFSHASDPELQREQKALDIINSFADKICQTPKIEGNTREAELSGSGKADLGRVVAKIADLNFQGAVKYKQSEYQGALQKDVATLIEQGNQCKLKVFEDLKDRLLRKDQGSSGTLNPASVVLMPASGRMELYNYSDRELYLWGDRFDSGRADIEVNFRLIPKDHSYYFLTERLSHWALANIGQNGTRLCPFYVYLADSGGTRYIAAFDLLIQMQGGKMVVNTQQLGISPGDWRTGH